MGPVLNITSPAAFAVVGSGVVMGSLADGIHRVTVTGVDDYGNQTSELVDFTVDATGPLLVVSAPVAGGSYVSPKNAFFTATEAATFYCAIDAGPTFICTSPYAMSLSAGTHQLRVYATDQLGNTGSTVSRTFTIL